MAKKQLQFFYTQEKFWKLRSGLLQVLRLALTREPSQPGAEAGQWLLGKARDNNMVVILCTALQCGFLLFTYDQIQIMSLWTMTKVMSHLFTALYQQSSDLTLLAMLILISWTGFFTIVTLSPFVVSKYLGLWGKDIQICSS